MEPSPGNQPSPRPISPSPPSLCSDWENPQSDYENAIAYLYGRINYERTAETAPYPFRLRRMNELLDRLDLRGIAGGKVPVVHIAGTKGKGSTSTMVASILTAAGYRTGLYTSPHLVRLEERFTVDGTLAESPTVIALIEALRREADPMASTDLGAPTFFEMTTAMALMHFRNSGCTAVVLEVGLGGKLDSTNVCQPTVTAITSIGYDHQHILGNTLAEIAAQKAGIIKPGVPIISGVLQAEPRAVIEAIAQNNSAPLYAIDRDFTVRPAVNRPDTSIPHSPQPGSRQLDSVHPGSPRPGTPGRGAGGEGRSSQIDSNPLPTQYPPQSEQTSLKSKPFLPAEPDVAGTWSTCFDFVAHTPPLTNREAWSVPLDGEHQAKNAAVACAIVDLLEKQGVPIPRIAQAKGLNRVKIAGRVERFCISESTDLILDTAHNVDSIEALCRCIERRALGRPVTIVFGTSKDKEHVPMLAKLAEQADAMILTRYHANPRYRETAELLRDLPAPLRANPIAAQIIDEPIAAVQQAIQSITGPHLIVVCGSFFLAAEVRPFLEANYS